MFSLENNMILNNLNEAMADEWLAMFQYFTEVRILEESNFKQTIIKELKQHAMEEYKHAGWIANRIMELGGTIITNPSDLIITSGCGIIEPKNSNSIIILDEAIKGERCAIESYTNMAQIAKMNNDLITYDMFMRIIEDELNHEKELNQLKEIYASSN